KGATLGLMRDGAISIVAATGVGEIVIGATLPLAASVSGRAVREHQAVIVNDMANEPLAYGPTRIAAGVEKTLVAPMFASGGAVGVLAVLNRDEDFTPADAVVLQRLADQVAVAVTNARLYEDAQALAERYRHVSEEQRRARDAVIQSEARYRNLFDSATDAIFTLDAHAMFTSANDAVSALTGWRREELLGRGPFQLFVDEEVPHVKEHIKSAQAGTARRFE